MKCEVFSLLENTDFRVFIIMPSALIEPLPQNKVGLNEQRIDYNWASHTNQEGYPIR